MEINSHQAIESKHSYYISLLLAKDCYVQFFHITDMEIVGADRREKMSRVL